MVSNNAKFHEIAHIFCYDINTPQEDTVKTGEEAQLCLYNGLAKDDLKRLRYERYSEKVKKSSKAFNLAPTSAAARYHSMRVYFHLNEEKGEKESEFALIYPRLLTCSQFYLNCWRCFFVTVKQVVAH